MCCVTGVVARVTHGNQGSAPPSPQLQSSRSAESTPRKNIVSTILSSLDHLPDTHSYFTLEHLPLLFIALNPFTPLFSLSLTHYSSFFLPYTLPDTHSHFTLEHLPLSFALCPFNPLLPFISHPLLLIPHSSSLIPSPDTALPLTNYLPSHIPYFFTFYRLVPFPCRPLNYLPHPHPLPLGKYYCRFLDPLNNFFFPLSLFPLFPPFGAVMSRIFFI